MDLDTVIEVKDVISILNRLLCNYLLYLLTASEGSRIGCRQQNRAHNHRCAGGLFSELVNGICVRVCLCILETLRSRQISNPMEV